MSTAIALPDNYAERVYAGVLGKVIGVYLGRPFEGWTYERIQQQLGDVDYYVHDRLDVPLIVTDDDISGTFTFIRALEDHGDNTNLSAAEIGESWLNYLIRERTILWWGGLGNSTEHTAYIRLASGIPAPESGSMARNGQVVAEQIGAQIFIDGWAMVSPGDPAQAVRFADAAARVSHDGEAVNGARMLAAMEAIAFVDADPERIIESALAYIPRDSVIARMIDDIRAWHAQDSDWRATREQLQAHYGYDKYGGNCHMVPNHGLIIHSLLHGAGDFSETLKIVNTCGWDTDCNSGNVGCLLGIMGGLEGIDAGMNKGLDWRGPVADRIYIPTADGGRAISDCASEALHIVNMGRRLHGESEFEPKAGAQFHFTFPGSLQGFTVTQGDAEIQNKLVDNERVLSIASRGPAQIGSPVFTPSKSTAKYFERAGYALLASPRVFPGQLLTADLSADAPVTVTLYIKYYGENDQETTAGLETASLRPGEPLQLQATVPNVSGPVYEVGVSVAERTRSLHLRSLRWQGSPTVSFTKPEHSGSMWRRAWVNGVDILQAWNWQSEMLRLIQNDGMGMVMQGSNEWRDYTASAEIRPHLANRAGLGARVQGLTRGYALLLAPDNQLQLVLRDHQESVLATTRFEWRYGQVYHMAIHCNGPKITGTINGAELLSVEDHTHSYGAMSLIAEAGRVEVLLADVTAV